MIWDCYLFQDTSLLHIIKGTMKSDTNCKILKNFDQSAKQLKLPKCWMFQHDSHLKHTAMKTKELINTKKI